MTNLVEVNTCDLTGDALSYAVGLSTVGMGQDQLDAFVTTSGSVEDDMRAIVAAVLGETVSVPKELIA